MVVKYDELDLEILRELKENSKMPYRKMAAKLGVHPNTLMQRIKRLEREKIIEKYTVELNFDKIGYETQVVILMKARGGKIGDRSQLSDLAKIPQVQSLYGITGTYDVIAFLLVKSRDELVAVLKHIQEHPVVARTNSHIILFSYKTFEDFNPLK